MASNVARSVRYKVAAHAPAFARALAECSRAECKLSCSTEAAQDTGRGGELCAHGGQRQGKGVGGFGALGGMREQERKRRHKG